MRTQKNFRRLARLGALTLVAGVAALPSGAAMAGSGGVGGGGDSGGHQTTSGGEAKLSHGKAIPPQSAPQRVKQVIYAANNIAKGKDYCYGGGHSSFKDNCYDCSGSVSYALHGGNLIHHPMDSNGLARWASKGKGNWISVYGNSSHAFMTVAGLRFDTSDTKGGGPGWARGMGAENPRSFAVRHKGSL